MDLVENQIIEIIKNFQATPYLFIGSGFSRRYLNLEDWEGLLRKFCQYIKPYEYYKSTYNNDLPKIAEAMCIDYNHMMWHSSDEHIITFREENITKFKDTSSALKLSIGNYLMDYGITQINADYKIEIKDFKAVTVEGIITTNWDRLLKDLFPSFHEVIGQDELVASSTIGIGEIFKIHGCSSAFNSLVLTEEDYKDFNKRNAYLAAKLVTYFVEHPVIFIGYSLTDENVTEILSSIVNCLGKSNIDRLSNNFIFVQRASGEEKIKSSYKDIGGSQIPIIVMELSDYSKLYRPLAKIKRKLPIRVLRYLKEQLYEFVNTNDPKTKVAVINLEDSENVENLEIAIGIGIMSKLGAVGYHQIKTADIIEHVLFDNKGYEAREILEKTLPDSRGFIPIHYFVKKLESFNTQTLSGNALKNFKYKLQNFQATQYKGQFNRDWKGQPFKKLISEVESDKAMHFIPFFDFKTQEDIDELGEFLKSNFKNYFEKSKDIGGAKTTFYRKAVCFYDFLKYYIPPM